MFSKAELFAAQLLRASWEGMVIEHLIANAPQNSTASYYRTRAGAEVDLVLNFGTGLWAIEIKLSTAPKLSRGFYHACEDLTPERKLLVYPGADYYELEEGILVCSLEAALEMLRDR